MNTNSPRNIWTCPERVEIWRKMPEKYRYVSVKLGSVFTREQIRNCDDELWLRYFNYWVYTRERRLLRFCGLAFQSEEKKRGSFLCSDWHADCYFIWDRIYIRKCAVYRWKWLEGHVAPPPKSQFRGQGIHTAISLRDLRDASLENTSGP